MKELDGKVAVVTGSASGLGRAMAHRFAHEGMVVVVADNRLHEAEIVAEDIARNGGDAVAIQVDVIQRDSVNALADRVDADFGGASLLVNNAGVASFSPVLEPQEDGWRWIVDVNLFGVVYGLQAFLPRMLARTDESHVVNTASLAGVVGADGVAGNRVADGDATPVVNGMYGYMATKHAVVAISEMLARDLQGTRIGVSVLCPSHHDHTGIFENSARYRPAAFGGPMSNEEVEAAFGRIAEQRGETYGQQPEQRQPEECAGRVVRAIRERQFYIFTHPETRSAIEHRFAQMLAGYDDASAFTE
jgi:NAD(P)-dependent dehydrogenase (short-subunit alcohol dehydrogenase family)